jgi:hypothetical protein
MKTQFIVGLAALATLAAVPAFAQTPAPAAPAEAPAAGATTTTTTTTTAGGAMSVDKTTIGAMMADPAAKAVLEKDVPGIDQYLDQIKDMTLAQVAPMSQGAIDDAKLKVIQADLDKK